MGLSCSHWVLGSQVLFQSMVLSYFLLDSGFTGPVSEHGFVLFLLVSWFTGPVSEHGFVLFLLGSGFTGPVSEHGFVLF